MNRFRILIAFLPFLILTAQGCSHTQTIKVESVPSGAAVMCEGKFLGGTPTKIDVDRRSKTVDLRLELSGYRPQTVVLERKNSNNYILHSLLLGSSTFAINYVAADESSNRTRFCLALSGLVTCANLLLNRASSRHHKLHPTKLNYTLEPEASPITILPQPTKTSR